MPHINNVSLFRSTGVGTSEIEDKEKEIRLEDISLLYTTELQEDERTSFEDTFDETDADETDTGQKFLNSLIDNKTSLMAELGLTDEEYDQLACTALALASQETGMGYEDGYKGENTGLGGFMRRVAKWADVKIFGGASASSGLTQMKIYDFLNSPDKLSDEQKEILNEYGITAKGVATNNLYDNPDKAAIATMVVLKSITEKYDDYQNVLSDAHSELETELGLTSEAEKAAALEKGETILAEISSAYANATDEEKAQIRREFKDWLIASDDTKKGDKVDKQYNEEIQLEELNNLLGGNPSLDASDLDYIRYALTATGSEMNITEYCAYAWNKGTGESGMKLDRLLSDKIGTILANPEDFDYDQFTVNVATLAEKYANQTK